METMLGEKCMSILDRKAATGAGKNFTTPQIQSPDCKMGTKATQRQVGGDHYKNMAIQPVKYIHANGIPFIEGCVIKYISRWRSVGGIQDLRKAIHFIELLIELESGETDPTIVDPPL